jgi:RNA polymerase sigma-70 factor (ECF subfamily)
VAIVSPADGASIKGNVITLDVEAAGVSIVKAFRSCLPGAEPMGRFRATNPAMGTTELAPGRTPPALGVALRLATDRRRMVAVEPTDEALIAAVAEGDRAALRELHARHSPWIGSRLSRRCGDPDVVAEAVQDTFVAVWRNARSWDGRGQPAAWLWGIAIRRLIAVLRVRRRWARVTVLASDEPDIVVAAEDQVLLAVEHGSLAGALGQLSPELRAVVQATVLDGLTTREAARLLGIPAGTVKTRMMRAKAQLREALA